MNPKAAAIIARAQRRGISIATAESCTGGLIAAALTDVAGASAVFGYGFVCYANEAKIDMLDVGADLLAAHGAVSELVAGAMADGARARADADLAIAVTGIAGPEGGSADKPVGTVWFGMARRGVATTAERAVFAGDRAAIRAAAVERALDLLGQAVD